ncbi:uncharacterized protein LOC135401262 [Ornithodoros turicata]|uniref:uncharacterized protein LOC135401262 n=1 Tax=Ornithodoros turicata TaxID=34597 RepID=UPI00313A021D
MTLLHISVFCALIVALASADDKDGPSVPACPPGQVSGLKAKCFMELEQYEEFRGAPKLELLDKNEPTHHKFGCCMERTLAKCYKEKFTGDCAGLVDGLVRNNQEIMVKTFGGRRCDYHCPNGSYALRPTWTLGAAALLSFFVFTRKA